ncbi:MAG: D-glycerate dehydrogenase [Nitrososphaeria archaeon]|nr:D-glycerate dehydrogenase [Nitrososphaeria archaeon]
MKKKVLAPELVPSIGEWSEKPDPIELKRLTEKLMEFAEVEVYHPKSASEWLEKMADVNVLAGGIRVDKEFLKAAKNLELIQGFGIGYDHVDVEECSRRGIIVCNVGEIYAEPVAQHALALMLDLSKKITLADRAVREGRWKKMDWMGVQLWNKTLGIIGLGNIGGRIALKCRLAFNMKILAYDPYVLPARAQLYGAELVSLEKLLQESDFIVLSVPLTTETRKLIGERELMLMKKSAYLVNICRGAVIDTSALIKALKDNVIAGAGLDVTEPEPLPEDNPLLTMENVILTPHIASSTKEAVYETFRAAVENIIRFLKGEKPYWVINPETIYKRK